MLFAAMASAAALAAPAGQLAYSDALGSLYLSNADGSGSRMLFAGDTAAALQTLEVSKDGTSVLALETGDQRRLVLMPIAGGARRGIPGTADATGGTLSPDGKQAVFTNANGIYSIGLAGGTPLTLATTPAGASDSLPAYSPDGKTLAFARATTNAAGDALASLETIPAAGGAPKQIASGVLAAAVDGGRISFSPDGQRLVFAGDAGHPGIASVAISGGPPAQVTTDLDYWPAFLDSATLLFARSATSPNADGSQPAPRFPVNADLYELWTVHVDGSSAEVLAEGDFEALAAHVPAATPPPNPPPPPVPAVIAKLPPQSVTHVIAAGGFPLAVTCARACTVTSTLVGSLPHARRVTATAVQVWGRGSIRRPNGGRSKLFVRLNASAKKRFPKASRFTLTLRTTIQSGTGSRTTSQPVSFRP